ncbi:MAG: PAS domain-containing hybrid sensor histidine kinase/response regulator, partial [Pseudomonadota bacterium]
MLPSAVIAVTALYVGALFWVAHWTEKQGQGRSGRAWIFGLSLAVYCTSWTYYGAVGTAATGGWDYLPIYLGPALVFAFGGGFLKRLLEVGKRHHVTSISDFISSRYGKSQRLGAIITLIAVLGALPYIALQLKSIASTYAVLTGGLESASRQNDLVLVIAIILAIFAMAFGTRHPDVTRPNAGMVRAIVVESAFKLAVLLLIGALSLWLLFAGGAANIDAVAVANALPDQGVFSTEQLDLRFVSLTLLSMAAIVCLPRQFHVLVVEATDPKHLVGARWVFVGYMVLTAAVVIPITFAGLHNLPTGVAPDLFVLMLPMEAGQTTLAILTFLGGFAAATGMVIVSSVALSVMVTNDLLFPFFLKGLDAKTEGETDLARKQRSLRRFTILALLGFAYGFHRMVTQEQTLAALGILAFAGAIQFLPALIGGLYWPKGNKRGVLAGLLLGGAMWAFTLVLPALAPVFETAQAIVEQGLFGLYWLRPENLLGFEGLDPLSHGLLWSLGLNGFAYVVLSQIVRPDGLDIMQAKAFTNSGSRPLEPLLETSARVKDLKAIIVRTVGSDRAEKAWRAYELLSGKAVLDRDPLNADLIRFGESQLTRVLGAASARLLLSSVLAGRSLKPEDVVTLLDETSQQLEFNRELLQATLENIVHGVCVVDQDMRIAAWNTPYVEMFDYPAALISVGRPIADVIRYNAEKGTWPGEETETVVTRRVGHMRAGKPHDFSRSHHDGRFIDIQGRPMPGGGYVTTYMDVTARVAAEDALKKTNETLEQRVRERTRDLEVLNQELEKATASKTRFLAAASHDLLQPLSAARLFTSALQEELPGEAADKTALLDKIDQSIASADSLLKALLNISKLDGGGIEPRFTSFCLGDLLTELHDEFAIITGAKGVDLRMVDTKEFVRSDRALLRSVLQNFLSNAARYCGSGSILFGCRRSGDTLRIQVWDTGPGIPQHEQRKIFEEFHQLRQRGTGPREGLGLGLAIVRRIARLLNHPVALVSNPGQGSCFEIKVPIAPREVDIRPAKVSTVGPLDALDVLCIDNDPVILNATVALLKRWGCNPRTIATAQELEASAASKAVPDLILLDYQLDDGATGFDYLNILSERWEMLPPVIL